MNGAHQGVALSMILRSSQKLIGRCALLIDFPSRPYGYFLLEELMLSETAPLCCGE
jgi:hypothetical protein